MAEQLNIKEALIESVKERFKANAVVKALEKKIKAIAESQITEKYSDAILSQDGMDFEFGGVKTHFDIWSISIGCVEVKLAYFACSKLSKAKRDRIKKVKELYLKAGYLEWNNRKIALWHELRYDVSIDEILEGRINLLIE